MTLECVKAAKLLSKFNISAEVIDLRSIQPIDSSTILESINKTKRLLVVDHADPTCGVASEIISLAVESCGTTLLSNPKRLCLPPHPVPTSHVLAADYYPTAHTIVNSVLEVLDMSRSTHLPPQDNIPKDQPNKDFVGPF